MGKGPKYFSLKSFTGQPSKPRLFALIAFDNNLVGLLLSLPKEHWKSATDLKPRRRKLRTCGNCHLLAGWPQGGLTQVFWVFQHSYQVATSVSCSISRLKHRNFEEDQHVGIVRLHFVGVNPSGCRLLRMGRGPKVFAHTVLDHVLQGGDTIKAENLPADTCSMSSCCKSWSIKSWSDPLRMSTSWQFQATLRAASACK